MFNKVKLVLSLPLLCVCVCVCWDNHHLSLTFGHLNSILKSSVQRKVHISSCKATVGMEFNWFSILLNRMQLAFPIKVTYLEQKFNSYDVVQSNTWTELGKQGILLSRSTHYKIPCGVQCVQLMPQIESVVHSIMLSLGFQFSHYRFSENVFWETMV